MAPNVGVYFVAGIGGFKNGAKRNVKTDLHVLVPRHPNEIKKQKLQRNTEPRNKINIVLCTVRSVERYNGEKSLSTVANGILKSGQSRQL